MKPRLTRFIQFIFYPLMVAIGLTLAFVLVHTLEEKYFSFIPGIQLLFFIPVFLVCEKYWPYRAEWTENKGDLVNDYVQTFVVFSTALKIAEFLIPLVFYFPVVWLTAYFGHNGMLKEMNIVAAFIIGLVVCEFFYYWFHRASHRIKGLWRFHSVHHGAGRVYWVNAARFHFLEALVSSTIYFFPLVLLNASPQAVMLVVAFSSVTGFLEHININFKAGFFNYIFNTAELHRWHHSRVIEESDRNFGKALVIYDMLFGTYFNPKNREVGKVGIDNADVPTKFMGQLMYPFKKTS